LFKKTYFLFSAQNIEIIEFEAESQKLPTEIEEESQKLPVELEDESQRLPTDFEENSQRLDCGFESDSTNPDTDDSENEEVAYPIKEKSILFFENSNKTF
jgi:hypothetical protein